MTAGGEVASRCSSLLSNMAPTSAQILLSTVQAAIEADVRRLQELSRQHKLNPELVLRILLTFLPESAEPATYLPLLDDIAFGLPELPDDGGSSLHPRTEQKVSGEHTSPEEAKRRVRTLRLLPLAVDDQVEPAPGDSLPQNIVAFVLLRARRIDVETGALLLIQQLVEHFAERNTYLKLWLGSVILPLIRLNYEIYPNRDEPVTLDEFEELRGGAALDILVGGGIDGCQNPEDYARDLTLLVGPWLQGEIYRRNQKQKAKSRSDSKGRSKDESVVVAWDWIDNWLLHLARRDHTTALAIVKNGDWNGPGVLDESVWVGESLHINNWIWGTSSPVKSPLYSKIRESYSRTCLALFYTLQEATEEAFDSLERVLVQVAERSKAEESVSAILHGMTAEKQSYISNATFDKAKIAAHNMNPAALVDSSNPFSNLGSESFLLAAWYLRSSIKLLSLDMPLPISRTVQMGLLGTPSEQRGLLQRYLRILDDRTVDEQSCAQLWDNVKLLHGHPAGKEGESKSCGVWGQLEEEEIALTFMKALVTSGRYKLAASMYLTDKNIVTKEKVEETVLAVALSIFDSATNGNRNRGGMKKASDILSTFAPHFPHSQKFSRFEALARATHALSFYSLTLQHGVLCTPVYIRTQTQPFALIDKVLSQNQEAYTALDDLTRISVDLAKAGLLVMSSGRLSGSHSTHGTQTMPSFLTVPNDDLDDAIRAVTQAVASKAIRASLDAGDFDTAYSYITTRLSGMATPDTFEAVEDESTLWRTALAAGRFESRNEARSGPKYLRRLEQKMELLASALELAPPPALAQVLEAWQECEAQVNAAATQENEAQLAWDDGGNKRVSMRVTGGDRHLPGGFGTESWIPNAEGTGGRRWAGGEDEAPMGLFDVARGAAAALQKSAARRSGQFSSAQKQQQLGDDDEVDGQGRVRKRDMVSSAVTSGLVSGIGWVIGANSTREQ